MVFPKSDVSVKKLENGKVSMDRDQQRLTATTDGGSKPNMSTQIPEWTFPRQASHRKPQNGSAMLNSFSPAPQQGKPDESPMDRVDRSFKAVNLSGLHEYGISTTMYGKAFWLSLVVLAVLATVFGIFKLFINYYNCPVATEYKVVTSDSMTLPKIQICMESSMNQKHLVNKSWLLDFARVIRESIVTMESLDSASPSKQRPKRFAELELIIGDPEDEAASREMEDEPEEDAGLRSARVRRDLQEHGINADNLTEMYQLLMNISFTTDEVFLQCLFRDNFTAITNCTEIVTEVFNPNYGKCFLLDTGDMRQRTPGQGLILILDGNVKDYVVNKTIAPKNEGFLLTIDEHYNPYNFVFINVELGVYTRVSLSKEHHQYLNIPEGPRAQPCVEKGSMELDVLNLSYSVTACRMDCFQHVIVKICGCVLAQDPRFVRTEVLASKRFCTSRDMETCVRPRITNAHQQVDECCSKCHVPCDRWKFFVQTSSMKLHKPPSSSFDYEHLAYIHIAFSDLSYASVSQEWSIKLENFIADLGGQIGLWTGASMITFVHIPVMLLALTIAYIRWRITGLRKLTNVLNHRASLWTTVLDMKK